VKPFDQKVSDQALNSAKKNRVLQLPMTEELFDIDIVSFGVSNEWLGNFM